MTSALSIRSLLFVPTLQERFVQSALKSPADAIVLDLEDAVAPSQKDKARAALASVSAVLAQAGRRVFVRINSMPLAMAQADTEAAAACPVEGVLVPKTETAEQLEAIRRFAARTRTAGSAPLALIPLVETPRGVMNAAPIAAAQDVVGLAFGTEDYAIAVGARPVETAMLVPAQMMAIAARAAGVAALGVPGSIAVVDDMAAWGHMVETARLIGMSGVLCVHPKQVTVANGVYTPTADDARAAEQTRRVFEAALARGEGAAKVDGRMIDIPHYNKALKTLELARLYAVI